LTFIPSPSSSFFFPFPLASFFALGAFGALGFFFSFSFFSFFSFLTSFLTFFFGTSSSSSSFSESSTAVLRFFAGDSEVDFLGFLGEPAEEPASSSSLASPSTSGLTSSMMTYD
jgi:hypothetical protein